MTDNNKDSDLAIEFAKQLERIKAQLAAAKPHARGPKRPSLGQQDERTN